MRKYFKEFTDNPNVVSNMSVLEYFKRKNIEVPDIEFVAIPVEHEGELNADKVISVLERDGANILMYENISNLGVAKIEEQILSNFKSSQSVFLKKIFEYCLEHGIPYTCFEQNHQKEQIAKNYIEKLLENLPRHVDLESAYKNNDLEEAFKEVSDSIKNLKEFQTEREWLMLSSIAPNLLELIEKNPDLIKSQNKLKVAFFVGSAHKQGFIDSMINRGDNVKVYKDGDLVEDLYSLDGLIHTKTLGHFLEMFEDEFGEFDYFETKLVRSNFNLRPLFLLQKIIEAKTQEDPREYFIGQIAKKS